MAEEKTQPQPEARPEQVRTTKELAEKIREVQTRVEEASKPAGPLKLFRVTTTT